MRLRKIISVILFYILIISVFLTATYWGSIATTVIAEKIPLKRNNTIIIDAGHGGIDGGSTSCTGKLESSFNLEIAATMNDLFRLLGLHTKMIRTTDISIHTEGETIASQKVSDLKNRVSIVNETENGLLLSIHQNTFPDNQCSGAQVFYGAKEESKLLAEELQTVFIQTINAGSTRRSKPADGVYLMQHIDKTGVLIECGFLSNPEEEAKLADESYQKKLCSVVATTVFNFLDR